MSQFMLRWSHFQRQRWEHYMTASWMPYLERYVIRSFPLVRSKGSPPRTNDLTRLPVVTDPPPKNAVPWFV